MKKQISQLKVVRRYLLSILLVTIIGNVCSQPDTIYPQNLIIPQNSYLDSLNFLLTNASPIGDINGDSLIDFAVNTKSAFNNQPGPLGLHIQKSAVLTDLDNPEDADVYYNTNIQGIGDYNGDGYDDIFDVNSHIILFGNSSGQNFDSLKLSLPDNLNSVQYSKDITGDGKSDFVIGNDKIDYGLFVVSSEFDTCTKLPFGYYVNQDFPNLIDFFDYNGDSIKELFVATFNGFDFNYVWFKYDSVERDFFRMNWVVKFNYASPNGIFERTISDLNGDGLRDLCFVGSYDGELYLEVLFGNDSLPDLFEDPVLIDIDIDNRMFYYAGDYNNDGYGDFYYKSSPNNIIMCYGNPEIKDHGFIKKSTVFDNDILLTPFSNSPEFLGIHICDDFDYNQDGYSDIMLDYRKFNIHRRYDTTGMQLFFGNPDSLMSERKTIGLEEEYYGGIVSFGEKVKNVGDINKDGYEDFAIMASGKKYIDIYFGNDQLDFDPDIKVLIPQYPVTKCFDMAFNDLNNDSWIDIVVSHGHESSLVNTIQSIIDEYQQVLVFYGGPYLPDTLSIIDVGDTLVGINYSFSFGNSLAIPGDYNADGYNDLVVSGGSNKQSPGAFLYYGGVSLPPTPSTILNSYSYIHGSYFGYPATACGDINADGYSDLTLGARGMYNGKSLVYYGGPNSDSLQDIYIHNPNPDGSSFGNLTASVEGDYNNDGYPDLIHYERKDHIIYIYLGGPNFDNTYDLTISDTIYDSFKKGIDFIDGFTNTGQSDIALFTHKRHGIYVYKGSNSNKIDAEFFLKSHLSPIENIASGDFNNDGRIDVIGGSLYGPFDGQCRTGQAYHFVSPFYVSTEVQKTDPEKIFDIFPNPAKDQLTIQYTGETDERIEMEIKSIKGEIVSRNTMESNQYLGINIGHLKPGVYTISILDNGSKMTKKFIKIN